MISLTNSFTKKTQARKDYFRQSDMYTLLIIANLYVIGAFACERATFVNTSVTAVGVRGVDVISGCLEPIGALEKASYIQIVNQSIPALYAGAVQNLQNLADLILDDNGIVEIEPGAFYNLPKLKILRLKNNAITTIRTGVLSGLTVSEINFMNNSITSIDADAFDNMTNLVVVNFELNKIAQWNKDWFFNCPNVNTLSFKKNQITALPSRAFQHIKGFHQVAGRNVTTNIFLSENKIAHVDSRSLEGLEVIGWLFLTKNQIAELDEDWLSSIQQIDWLKLGYNQLTCVPEKILQKIPAVSRYLDGNPLTDECKERLSKI